MTGILGAALSVTPTHLAPSDALTYVTGTGENRVASFTDDTVVHVNASTSLMIKETPDRRIAYLDQGELAAHMRHGHSKPLDIVVRGEIWLQDLGTALDVACHGNVITIAITDGKVRVSHLNPDASQSDPIDTTGSRPGRNPTYLEAGDLARLEIRDGVAMLSRDNNSLQEASSRFSWIEGKLEAGSERLDEMVWQLNAHNSTTQILIEDPTVAGIRVGGTYSVFNSPDFLKAVPSSLNLEAVPVSGTGETRTQTYILQRPVVATSLTRRH